MLDLATFKLSHLAVSAVFSASLVAMGVEAQALDYPDIRAFLVYACYGSMGATALSIWSTRFRSPLKFAGILFTGAVVAGLVGPAVAAYTGPAVAPLAAFVAALMGPAFVMDPVGTVKRVLLAWREYTRNDPPGGGNDDYNSP